MEEVEIILRLPRALVDAVRSTMSDNLALAGAGIGCEIGAALEHATRRAIVALDDERPGLPLLAQLRRHLAGDFAEAQSWPELQGRLMLRGYALRHVGGELRITARSGGHWLARLRDIGPTQDMLTDRFGQDFPTPRTAPHRTANGPRSGGFHLRLVPAGPTIKDGAP